MLPNLLQLCKQHNKCSERTKKYSSVFARFLSEGEMSRACTESHPCVVNYEIDGKSSHCFPDLSFSFRVTKGFDAPFPRYLRLSVQISFQIFSQCPGHFIINNQEKER